jgi:methylglutaconyl-CoA hydratase
MALILSEISGYVATITLNRPDKRNALSKDLITELIAAVATADHDQDVRLLVVRGAGEHLCAGADLEWMRGALHASREENASDARLIAQLMATINAASTPVIVRLHGAAIGAGAGLVAVGDIVIAEEHAKIGFSEVRLGIIPSVIAPYVVPKIGIAQARRYFITGERISAAVGKSIGLIHEVVPADALDGQIHHLAEQILCGGPTAVQEAKRLVCSVAGVVSTEMIEEKITKLAEIRITDEAQEGMSAFLERRQPKWID